jgi:hypothetical protein
VVNPITPTKIRPTAIGTIPEVVVMALCLLTIAIGAIVYCPRPKFLNFAGENEDFDDEGLLKGA